MLATLSEPTLDQHKTNKEATLGQHGGLTWVKQVVFVQIGILRQRKWTSAYEQDPLMQH